MQNENLKMVIIVPDEVDGLGQVLDNLESFNSTRLAKSAYSRDVQLYLPKFKIESTIDLKEPLQKVINPYIHIHIYYKRAFFINLL